MTHKILILLVTISVSLQAAAQGNDLKSLLKSMPEDVLPILTKNNVLDFIDFMDSNVKAEVTNRMQGKSEMTRLTPSLASISLTSFTKVDIKLLPKGNDGVLIYLVSTSITDSLSDSNVTVYNSDWTLADDNLQFKKPNPARFTHLILSESNDELTILEVERPVRFEGESEEMRPDITYEYTLHWNSTKGCYERDL